MNRLENHSPQRHITSDLAGAFASLSRMASSFIRDTENTKAKTLPMPSGKCLPLSSLSCFSLCLSVSVVEVFQ
jgi:hypothetical protein